MISNEMFFRVALCSPSNAAWRQKGVKIGWTMVISALLFMGSKRNLENDGWMRVRRCVFTSVRL